MCRFPSFTCCRKSVPLVALALVVALGFGTASANGGGAGVAPSIYPPHSEVAAIPVGEWLARWWKWRFETPIGANPNDPDRNFAAGIACGAGQRDAVFYLPKPLTRLGGPRFERILRTCIVPPGTPIFVPLRSVLGWPTPGGCRDCADCSQAVRGAVNQTTVLELEIDGQPIDGLLAHREEPDDCFELLIPQANVVALAPGRRDNVWTEGFAVMVHPLPPGNHEIYVRRVVGPLANPSEDVEFIYEIEVSPPAVPAFLRGDGSGDGNLDLTDAVCVLDWLFGGAAKPGCLAALDTNGDGQVDIADPLWLLNYLFAGGPAPVEPFPDCGPGLLTSDVELGCARPRNCQ